LNCNQPSHRRHTGRTRNQNTHHHHYHPKTQFQNSHHLSQHHYHSKTAIITKIAIITTTTPKHHSKTAIIYLYTTTTPRHPSSLQHHLNPSNHYSISTPTTTKPPLSQPSTERLDPQTTTTNPRKPTPIVVTTPKTRPEK
jgi:hypothetical protein